MTLARRRLIAVGVLYLLAAIIAFGHAAAQSERRVQADYAKCLTTPQAICFREVAVAPISGLVAAILWPLYLSWELFDE